MAIVSPNEIVKRTQGSGDSTQSMIDWCLANGGTGNDVTQLQMSVLEAQGFTTGGLTDRWVAFLASLGYTGDFTEAFTNFWTDGATLVTADLQTVIDYFTPYAADGVSYFAYYTLDDMADLYSDQAGTVPAVLDGPVRCWKPRISSAHVTLAPYKNLQCADAIADAACMKVHQDSYGYYLEPSTVYGLQTSSTFMNETFSYFTGNQANFMAAAAFRSNASSYGISLIDLDRWQEKVDTLVDPVGMTIEWGKWASGASNKSITMQNCDGGTYYNYWDTGYDAPYTAPYQDPYIISTYQTFPDWSVVADRRKFFMKYQGNAWTSAAYNNGWSWYCGGVLCLFGGEYYTLDANKHRIYGGLLGGSVPEAAVPGGLDVVHEHLNSYMGVY